MNKTNFNTLIDDFADTIYNVINLNTTRFKINKRILFNHREEFLEIEEVYNPDQTINTYQYTLYKRLVDQTPMYPVFQFNYNSQESEESNKYKMVIGNPENDELLIKKDFIAQHNRLHIKSLSQLIAAIQFSFYFSTYEKRYNQVIDCFDRARKITDKILASSDEDKQKMKGESIYTQDAALLWKKGLCELQNRLSKPSYETWLSCTHGIKLEGNVLYISVAKEFDKEWLEVRYDYLICSVLEYITGKEMKPVFVVENK
ncbi:DnaA N-terminal domain-containing protein [Bacillus massiliigorillae]|uniref:DnaA N-terminal domain-containing protein n=1 Tax=Bacillus massiliigorillae TaxID=1243664 RepID=UPI0003A6FD71|nr:DnaA N-terminal domain-containing protein [Bacillus massiliigorillae]